MGASRDNGILVDFIKWFEHQHPREDYILEQNDHGAYIVRQNGEVIAYRHFYEHKVLELEWSTQNEQNNKKGGPK